MLDEQLNKELARVIVERMEAEGLTQSAVALHVGVSATAVSNWRRGTTPQTGLIAPLAEILKLRPEQLAALAYGSSESRTWAPSPAAGLAERLVALAAMMPPKRLEQLVTYAEFLGQEDWREERQRFALENLANAYGEDEPEYTVDDILP